MNMQESWRKISKRIESLTSGNKGPSGIMVGAYLETSFLPFPFEAFYIPAVLANKTRAMLFAHFALIGCVLGSLSFYIIGNYFFDTWGNDIIQYFGFQDEFNQLEAKVDEGFFWPIFLMSLLPFPIQVATLASGAFDVSVLTLMSAVILSRIIRYHGLALIVLFLGERIDAFIHNWPWYAKPLMVVAIFGLFIGAAFV